MPTTTGMKLHFSLGLDGFEVAIAASRSTRAMEWASVRTLCPGTDRFSNSLVLASRNTQ